MKVMNNFRFFTALLLTAGLLFSSSCDSGGGGGGGSDKSSVTKGVCIGDSIPRGLGVTTPYPAVLSGITGKTFINMGRDGATTAVGRFMVDAALAEKPSHVLIMFGVNDINQAVDFDTIAANIIAIDDKVSAAGAVPVIGEITPLTAQHADQNRYTIGVNGLIRSAAAAKGYAVAKTHKAVGTNIQSDGEHPTQEGANALASAFDKAF